MRLLAAMIVVLAVVALGGVGVYAEELVYADSFEEGMTGWHTYSKQPPQAKLSVVAGDAAAGQHFLRAEIPSGPALAGPCIEVKNLEGGRVYTVSAQVRGRGQISFMLYSGGLWLYGPAVQLTDEWQQIQLSKILRRGHSSISVDLLIPSKPQEALFEIDDVRVVKLDMPALKDVEVPPVRFEAEDWSDGGRAVSARDDAQGGMGLGDGHWFATSLMPFPQTRRPVQICLRVNAFTGDRVSLQSSNGGDMQSLVRRTVKGDGWQWIRLGQFNGAEIGETFRLYQIRPQRSAQQTFLDSVVLTTAPEVSETELDAVLPYTQRPFAVVGRARSAPAIDGSAVEAAWNDAITLQPFLSGIDGARPKAPTAARMMWDDDNLYMCFRCEEPILDPVNNRLNDFLHTKTERDDEIWRDECVAVILQPPGADELYDFWVNANGAVNDARAPLADAWGSRDTSYNPPVAVAAGIDDGFWQVEMAIPWSAVGGLPGQGLWRTCLGRRRHAETENTTWNAMPAGFHQPDYFGYLRFVSSAQSLSVDLPLRIAPTGNEIQLTTSPDQLPLALVLGSRPMAGRAMRSQLKTIRDKPSAQWSFDVAETGQIVFAASVLDGATLQPLMVSNEMTRRVEASSATLQIATEGDWQVRVGEAVVAAGSGDQEQVAVPLSEGANVVAVTFTDGSGAFSGEFQGTPLVSDDTWAMAGAELPEKFYSPHFDDTGLSRATVLGESKLTGARLIGADEGPVTVRKTLLWRYSRIWPKPVPCFYIAQNCPQYIVFPNPGLPGRALDDFRLHIAVPAGFEVLGATGYYGRRVEKLRIYSLAEGGTRVFDGEEYSVWQVTADKPVAYSYGHQIFDALDVFIRTIQAPTEGADAHIAYWLEAEHGAVIEAPQFMAVKILPPLRGKQPAQIRWQLWLSWFSRMDDMDMRAATAEAAQQAGINEFATAEDAETLAPLGISRLGNVHFWSGALTEHLKEHPEHSLVTSAGKHSDKLMCPVIWENEGWPAYEEYLRGLVEPNHPEAICWDIETGPFDGHFDCYCPRCLAAFAEFANLDAAELTPENIREEHADQWLQFIGRRCARLSRQTKDALHRLQPGINYSVYSGYQSESTLRSYSVDWQQMAELKAIDVAMCGYGRNKAMLAATREVLGDIPLITGAILTPYRKTEDRPVNAYTKARLLRRLIDGSAGVLVFGGHSMDGRCYWAIAEVSRLSADYEEIFLHGKLLEKWGEVGEANLPDSAVLEYNGRHLVAIMNEGSKPRTYQFRLPETGFAKGIEYYSGQAVRPGQLVKLELPPGGAAAYVLH